MTTQRLVGRVVLVTGSSSGIGRAVALACHAEGAVVVCADVRADPVEGGAPTASLVDGHEVLLDLADGAAVQALVPRVLAEHGRLDVLVNNAATYVSRTLAETTLADWERVMAVNVTAPFLLTRDAVRHWRSGEPGPDGVRGRVVNLSSQHGLVGAPADAAYGVSKGAVVQLTRQTATDHGPEGVVCNAVAPGKVVTGKGGREDDPEWVARWQSRTPYPRLGAPDDVAAAVVFLASDEARYVSGAVLMVDGGWSAS